MLPVESPFKTYTGIDGKPLNNGYVYFGLPNQNPVNVDQRVTVFWDAAGTIPASQPLRTLNGYIVRAGTPANVFCESAYSEVVQDSKKRQVFYAPTSDEFSISESISILIGSLSGDDGWSKVSGKQSVDGAVRRTLLSKLTDILNVMDLGNAGSGGDDTSILQSAINALASRGAGNLYCSAGKNFRISGQLNFNILGAGHRQYDIDFGGATFTWVGDSGATAPMFKGFNNKSLRVRNFTLLGSAASSPSKVTGLFLDSLQPGGSDLMTFQDYRIAYCDYAVVLGSTGSAQNRVSDSQLTVGVIENCRIGISIRSTDVDSLVIGPCTIISSCDEAIELVRAGFVKIYNVTGYNCKKFLTKKGPTEAILVENCQSERGDLASSIFFHQTNYTLSKRAPMTFLNTIADDEILIDYDPLIGSDPQIINYIGGLVTTVNVKAPDATLNLIGTTLVAEGTIKMTGVNSKLNNVGSKLYGTVVDTAKAASLIQPNGYRIEADGMLVQWGATDLFSVPASSTTSHDVAFSKPFSEIFTITVSATSPDASGSLAFLDAYGTSVDTFKVKTQNLNSGAAQSIGVSWIAYGR